MTNRPAGELSRPGDVVHSNLSGIIVTLANVVYRESPSKLGMFLENLPRVLDHGPLHSIRFGTGYISVVTKRKETSVTLQLMPSVVECHYCSEDATPAERLSLALKYKITDEQKVAVAQEIAKHFGIADLEFVCTEFRTDSDEATQREPVAFAEALFRGLDADFGSDHYRTLTFRPGVMTMKVKGNEYGHDYYLDVA